MPHPGTIFFHLVVWVVVSIAGITSYIDGCYYDTLLPFIEQFTLACSKPQDGLPTYVMDCPHSVTNSGAREISRNSDWLVFFTYALCIQVLLSCLFNCFIRAAALLKASLLFVCELLLMSQKFKLLLNQCTITKNSPRLHLAFWEQGHEMLTFDVRLHFTQYKGMGDQYQSEKAQWL